MSNKQNTVDAPITERTRGKSSTASLISSYPLSPIHNGTLTREEREEKFQKDVLDAVINDGGHTFGTYDTSYSTAPDIGTGVADGGEEELPSDFAPNPSSPTDGTVNASAKAAPPEGFAQAPSSDWGTGDGSQLSPKASSEKISSQTLGDYGLGKSSN